MRKMIYLIFIVGIVLDRITKCLALEHLTKVDTYPLWEGVLHLSYHENTGAAFSIFTGKTTMLSIFTSIVIIAGIWFMFNVKKKSPNAKAFIASIAMILSGAIGNLWDRVAYNYVVDFIDFRLINFAIFNVADSFITVGTIILCACLIFDKKLKL